MPGRRVLWVLLSLGLLVVCGVLFVRRYLPTPPQETLLCEGPAAPFLVDLAQARSSWSPQTVALGVWHRGEQILQCQQKASWGVDRKWDLWSVSKSILHAVVGASVELYGLNLEESYRGMRARDLLEFRSGLRWKESYEWNPLRSSIIEALFDPGRKQSLTDFVLDHGRPDRADAKYSSGDSILLAEWLNSKGISTSRIEREIFPRLGLSDLQMETDRRGLWIASSFTYGRLETLKNFGELYLEKSRHIGKGLHSSWVSALWEKQAQAGKGWDLLPHWWSFRDQESGSHHGWLVASGHWGQGVFLSRSQDLIIVRFGNDRFRRFDWKSFLENVSRVTETQNK